jgi:hypothetical protein
MTPIKSHGLTAILIDDWHDAKARMVKMEDLNKSCWTGVNLMGFARRSAYRCLPSAHCLRDYQVANRPFARYDVD